MVTQLKVVPANTALRLRAVLDFVEEGGTKRIAGDEWLFEGPGKTQHPPVDLSEIIKTIVPSVSFVLLEQMCKQIQFHFMVIAFYIND